MYIYLIIITIYFPAAGGSSPVISVEFGITFSASCSTLASQINITKLTDMAVAAISSAAALPSSYIAITGVKNTCGQQSRRRSLFQLSLSSPSHQNSVGAGDGTAIVKMTVTWPANVVTFTGMTSNRADLIVANGTSPEVMSLIFTPTFMAAYEIRSIPYSTVMTQSSASQNPNSVYSILGLGGEHIPI